MSLRTPRRLTGALAAVAAALVAVAAPAAQATSTGSGATGTRSLAAVLTADGNRFDRDWYDYDIVTEAALAVIAAKPGTKVALLADGSVKLTAFLPNDRAFQTLAADLTGTRPATEKATFDALVAAVGVDTIEAVLLYHVVPGATITARQALRSDGARLTTALGPTLGVQVRHHWWFPTITLVDQDPDAANARVLLWETDLNRGNAQIAHGISRVLRPVDL